ncbi:MAG: hypothetical protein KDD84_14185, partial [Caldilineaceae bacterium]|nr:hypothetical protein [Caldilineaceae bacterium]
IGVAKGQIEIEPFTRFAASGATLAVPDVCFMEAFAYAERIEKHPGALRTLANEQVRGIWATSRLAASQHLQQTIEEAEIAYDFLILEFSRNLESVIDQLLAHNSEIIACTENDLRQCLELRKALDLPEASDALILATILRHADQTTDTKRAFFSLNTADFDKPEVKQKVQSAHTTYLRSEIAVYGWMQAQHDQ